MKVRSSSTSFVLSLQPRDRQDGQTPTTTATTADAHKSTAITTTHRLTFVPHFRRTRSLLHGYGTVPADRRFVESHELHRLGTSHGRHQSTHCRWYRQRFGHQSGQWRSVYLTFSAHYAFKGRYIADFSIRRDGSTKFGDDSRWGNFPALSFRWNISDEKFMKALPWVNMLSIRPGWGIVGNQPGGEYLYFSKYANASPYNQNASVSPSNIRLSKPQVGREADLEPRFRPRPVQQHDHS